MSQTDLLNAEEKPARIFSPWCKRTAVTEMEHPSTSWSPGVRAGLGEQQHRGTPSSKQPLGLCWGLSAPPDHHDPLTIHQDPHAMPATPQAGLSSHCRALEGAGSNGMD